MADVFAPAADHLELLAVELTAYPKLQTKIIRQSGRPAYLRVVSKEAGRLAEDVTCEGDRRPGAKPGDVAYLFSWGDRIPGDGLAEIAATIARVLAVEPMPVR